VTNLGDLSRAEKLYQESLTLHRRVGNPRGVAQALSGLGIVATHRGNADRAFERHEECLALRRSLGDKRPIAYSLGHLADAALARGDADRAEALQNESVALSRELRASRGIAGSLGDLGTIASRRGDQAKAMDLFAKSLALQREIGDRAGLADTLLSAGCAATGTGEPDRAATNFLEAAALCQQLGDPVRHARCLDGLVAVATAGGNAESAVAVAGQRQGYQLTPVEMDDRDRRIETLRATLGETAFAVAWSTGSALTLNEALIRLAAEIASPLPRPRSARGPRQPAGLAACELDVRRHIAAGRNNAEVAADLTLSVRTVERHINNSYSKLQVRSRAEATAFAFRRHLASGRDPGGVPRTAPTAC
jgi:DNA-binding NarL/FixJ family response regulator